MANESLQELLCCMGQPVAGNPSQYMLEKAFAAAAIDWRYITVEVPAENLSDAMAGIKAMGFKGGNFTIPHKLAVIEHLDAVSEAAELMGAVNCVNRDDEGRYIGENTDGKGFVESLQATTDPSGKRVVILGAGGAARAIAVELGLAGIAHLTVVNRSAERGESLVALINDKVKVEAEYVAWEGNYAIAKEADILINATSIGLGDSKAEVPIEVETLRSDLLVADVIFNPPATWLIRTAQEKGCTTLDGLGMLVNQGVIGFRIWTGIEPDAAVMREALEEYLEL